jgi:hypothetical protein
MAAAVANLTLLAQADIANAAHRAPLDAALGAVLLLATLLALWALRREPARSLGATVWGSRLATRARPNIGAFRPDF